MEKTDFLLKTPFFYVEYPFLVHQLRFNVESVPVAMLKNRFDVEFVPGVMLQQLMLTSNPGFFVGISVHNYVNRVDRDPKHVLLPISGYRRPHGLKISA